MEYIGKCLLIEEKGKRILVIGDLHLGYEESLNRRGVLVSRVMFKDMIGYLGGVFDKVGNVNGVVLLGDVKHVFGGIVGQEWNDVLGLIDYLMGKCERIVIVKGNHDNIVEPIARKKGIEVLDYYIIGEYCLVHGDKEFDEMKNKKIKYWVMGHGHPAIKISEPGGAKMEKYKCFLVGKFKGMQIIIVPSFFEGNIGSDPREFDLGFPWKFNLGKFDVRVVGDSLEVLEFGKLGKLD